MLSHQPHIMTRWVEAKDCARLQSVFRACWTDAYCGIIPESDLKRLIAERNAAWWRAKARRSNEVLLLDVAGTIAGYARIGSCRGRWRASGEIYELYILPDFQGCGLGEHLFEASRQHLDSRDTNGLIVWSLADNERAIDFYWRRGGRPIAEARERFGTKVLTRIAFAWS
jgi:ribosomal protein S18 acetylase RimI-like enzyme